MMGCLIKNIEVFKGTPIPTKAESAFAVMPLAPIMNKICSLALSIAELTKASIVSQTEIGENLVGSLRSLSISLKLVYSCPSKVTLKSGLMTGNPFLRSSVEAFNSSLKATIFSEISFARFKSFWDLASV